MRNPKSIPSIPDNLKHTQKLRIANIKSYKDNALMSSSPKVVSKSAPAKNKRTLQPKIDAIEADRLHAIVVRYQRVVVERNARLGENARCDIEDSHIVYGALIALERVKNDEEFYKCIVDGKERR